jgi:hypothetical protein
VPDRTALQRGRRRRSITLEGGAGIGFHSRGAGNAKLETSHIYEHVAIRQEIHRATHPAKLEREKHELLEAIAAEGDESGGNKLSLES